MTSKKPIFIVGFPRSGTTFLQSLLCTQLGLVSFPETHFFTNGVGHYPADMKLDKDQFDELVQVIEAKNKITLSTDFKTELSGALASTGVDQKAVFEQLIHQRLKEYKKKSPEIPFRWIEKTPVNALYLDKIQQYYRDAKFVAIVRNPVHAIDSYYHKLVQYREPVHDLAAYWNRINKAIVDFSAHNSEKIKVVRYEDLASDQARCTAEIMAFIGEPFAPELLANYHQEAKELVHDDEHWKQSNVSDKTYAATKKTALSLKHVFQVQSILEKQMQQYGYKMKNPFLFSLYKAFKRMLR